MKLKMINNLHGSRPYNGVFSYHSQSGAIVISPPWGEREIILVNTHQFDANNRMCVFAKNGSMRIWFSGKPTGFRGAVYILLEKYAPKRQIFARLKKLLVKGMRRELVSFGFYVDANDKIASLGWWRVK
jgi:hypothetical protein